MPSSYPWLRFRPLHAADWHPYNCGSTACCYLPTRREEDVYMYVLLKGVAEAIEHCTQTQVKFTVVTAIYALEMAASVEARLTFRIGLCRTSRMYGKTPPAVIMVHFQHVRPILLPRPPCHLGPAQLDLQLPLYS